MADFSIPIPSFSTPISAGSTYVKITQPPPPPAVPESDLLKSIRRALSATTPVPNELPHRKVSPSHEGEEELFWHDKTVIWSVGNVQRRKWVFETEAKDQVLWACWANFHSNKFSRSGSMAYKAVSNARGAVLQPERDEDYIATFGRYSGIRPPTSQETAFARSYLLSRRVPSVTRCICIFLTSFVMIYTKEGGTEYAANLPFHVRRVWELNPHGVLMERVVAADEVDGDLLPTLFTLTGPYDEPKIAGFAHSIEGGIPAQTTRKQPTPGPIRPTVIHKDPPNDMDPPVRPLSKTERVILSSAEEDFNAMCNRVFVTHDPSQHVVRVWRCAQEDPAAPAKPPATVEEAQEMDKTTTPVAPPIAKTARPVMPNLPIASLNLKDVPSTPNQDTIAASLALAQQTAQGLNISSPPEADIQKRKASTHNRNQSQSRNELSITMDRMALGGSGEELRDHGLGNRIIDDGRMKPDFWFTCIHEFSIEEFGVPDGEVEAHMFDVRFDYCQKLAVFAPSKKTVFTFDLTCQDTTLVCLPLKTIPALGMASVGGVRAPIKDLFIIRPDNSLAIITYDFHELSITVSGDNADVEMSDSATPAASPFLFPNQSHPSFPPTTSDVKLAVKLKDAVRSSVTIVYSDGSEARVNVDLCAGPVVDTIFVNLSYGLSSDITFDLRKRYLRRWCAMRRTGTYDEEFSCFAEALMEALCQDDVGDVKPSDGGLQRMTSMNVLPDSWTLMADSFPHQRLVQSTALRHLELPFNPTPTTSSSPRVALPSRITRPPHWAADVMRMLHYQAETLQVNMAKHQDIRLMAALLVRVGRLVGLDWVNYWSLLAPESPDAWMPADSFGFSRETKGYGRPHDIFHVLAPILHLTTSPRPDLVAKLVPGLPTFDGKKAASLEYGLTRIFHATHRFVTDAYTALTDVKKHPNPLDRAKAAVSVMSAYGMTREQLHQFPFGISVPLKEALKLCQEAPPMDWEPHQYVLIDRYDLAKMAGFDWENNTSGFGEAYRYKQEAMYRDERETIGAIVQGAKLAADGLAPVDIEDSMSNREFTDVRFGVDRRLREVDRMLQSSSTTTVRILERPDLNEHDLAKEQHQFAVVIAERTLSLSLGRAMYAYGSLQSVDSDSFAIPKLDLSVRMVPQGVTIPVDQAKMLSQDTRIWGEFHNGVAAALRIARGTAGVDSTWIAFNRPNDLTSEHAGFILGLGLNGHLEGMYTWHTFSYLTPKHEMTTVAMLLGLAASYVGRGDSMVTRMLTVHTPALLPPGSAEMNLGLWTQMAGLMGIGVLYLGRKDRRMAEACLNEIGGRDFGSRLDVTNENREAYSVTAALAFGLIMCGHGNKAASAADLDMISKLRVLVQGQPDVGDSKQYQPVFGINLTSPAASIALGLMFMKTEREDIARLFDTSQTPLALGRVQPNVLLVRALARLLIMWEGITPSVEWVTTQVPKKTAENEELQGYDDAVKDSYDLAYYNIVAGVCFAVALKYAGSADQKAETTLLHYYDALSKTASQPAATFDAQIKRSAVRDSLNLLSLCVGMVMSGTGELNALRRLRYAHGQLMPYIKYGSHMTSHMALGMLFLGGGRHTFGTSNAAVACLVAAFYPRWPNSSGDTKGLLPVFRHLWALAVEPRCLIARDADSGETVYIPVKIRVQEGDMIKTYQYTSPSLVPDLSRLLTISVDSPRYWPFYIDFTSQQTPRFARNILRNQTLWVKRRSGYLGYGEDPRGNRSIFAFIGFRVGDTATMDFPNGSDEERKSIKSDLDQFITSFSVDTRTIGIADWLCHSTAESPLEAQVLSYCQQSLLECLLYDKTSIFPTLMNIFQMRYGTTTDGMVGTTAPTMVLRNLRFLNMYYSHYHNRSFGGRMGKERQLRPPLIRLTLLQSAINAMDDYVQTLRDDPDFKAVLHAYLRGEDVRQVTSAEDGLAMAHKLTFYITNENVPGVETLRAVGNEALRALRERRVGRTGGEEMDDGTLKKAVRTVARTLLLSAYGTPMMELSHRAFEDVAEAYGF